MRSWASSVEPPMCGVRITFSRPCSGETNASAIRARLDGEDVDGRAAQLAFAQRIRERLEVDDRAAAVVDEIGALLHRGESRLAPDHAVRGGRFRHMQADDVALRQQLTAGSRPGSVLP